MIELGMLTETTLPMIATRVRENTVRHGALAVFVDDRREVRALAHHAHDFDGLVQKRSGELIGVYVAQQEYARGKRQEWPVAGDLRVRLDELSAETARAA